jgi:internalin A
LVSLKELYLNKTSISDFSLLSRFKNLEYLGLDDTQIGDLSDLKELKKIKWLYVGKTSIHDFSLLKRLNNLERLGLNDTQIRCRGQPQFPTKMASGQLVFPTAGQL